VSLGTLRDINIWCLQVQQR